MDAGVQAGYVHAMLKTKKALIQDGKRMAIIFRNGIVKPHLQSQDNGKLVENLDPPPPSPEYIFGGMRKILKEGICYSRGHLGNVGGHQNAGGNIDGNQDVGCPSIAVCTMDRDWDADHFQFLTYETGDHSRHLALLTSFCESKPIGVFRCSKGNRELGKYFPVSPKSVYRYDGLYYIVAAKSRNGKDMKRSKSSGDARVFYLVRAEPVQTMDALSQKYPSARPYLPCKANHVSEFSARKSENLHPMVEPWNIDTFNEWNPKHGQG